MRHGILDRLQSLDDVVSLVLVVAPTGYGKTTLALQWSRSAGVPSAWLRVTRAHRDPALLVRDLAAALLPVAPEDGRLTRLVAEPEATAPGDAAAHLADAAGTVRGGLRIVLDDLHEAAGTGSLGVVERIAGLLPPGVRLLATANRPLQVPADPRTRGWWVRLGSTDLLFTADEVTSLLRDYGVVAPGEPAVQLVARTEGWPAGVVLAAAVVAGAADPTAAAARVSGDHEVVADHIRTQILPGLPEELVRFLRRTAVLPRMSGELCDAALDAVGSAACLSELVALGLPLESLDDRGEWFRYSRLFGEMLTAELRRREPGQDARVLRGASAWFETHGSLEDAVRCAVGVGDEELLARVLVAHTQDLNSRGRIGQIRRWLDDTDPGMLERHPPLAAMAVWIWALTGDAARALHALRVAERSTFDGTLPDRSVSLESAVLRGRAALAPDGLAAMLRDAERAVRLEPPGSDWHTMAALLLGCAQRLTGATQEAVRCFELAARYGRRKEFPGASLALAQHALLAADEEDWTTAQACTAEAVDMVRSAGLERYGPTLAVHLAEARVAVHTGDHALARACVRRALELYADPSPVAFPWLAAQAAIELGRLQLALGDVDAAADRSSETRRHLAVLPVAGLLTGWAESLADEVRRARGAGEPQETGVLTRAELRVLTLLPTHLSLRQIADELVISRNTVKAQVAAIYRKLDAANRADAVKRAHAAGLIPGMRPPP